MLPQYRRVEIRPSLFSETHGCDAERSAITISRFASVRKPSIPRIAVPIDLDDGE